MTTSTTPHRTLSGRVNVSADTWTTIWSFVHRVLVVNLGLAVTNLPLLVALAVVAQPWRYPVFFGLLSISVGPSLAAAFGYLDRASASSDQPPVRDFVRAYRRSFVPALARWSATVALLAVLITDIVVLHDSRHGAVLVPLLAVTAILLLATGVLVLALGVLAPHLGLRPVVRIAAYAVLRRAPLSLFSLVLLLVTVLSVNQAPLLGLATVPGCALVAVWANSRAALAHLLPDDTPEGHHRSREERP
ncbi:DUF624 domain-containing protein [Micromonospora sp. KC606]|uniref:DUF624 domain-containing protein n=1 Tax=Micromonospora sp. KC606 TaxID=2530379 RepID=UPI00104D7DF1|nr:DUF624 domain-containing protein [Micromonospora sp. KC606]TDC84957.1 DUF624 domain-containing protein [Micromonospora sp. KC606]